MADNEASKKSFMDNTLHALFDQLEARLSNYQLYQVDPNFGFIDLQLEFRYWQQLDFDPDRREPDFDENNNLLFCSDFCSRGPGEQEEVGRMFGIPLPADYLAFTERYSRYLLANRCPVELFPAKDIKNRIHALRISRHLDMQPPFRLFPFAEPARDPSFFAFRWSPDYRKMDVVFCEDSSDYGEPELLGPEGDQYVTDASFTAWLQRMLDTEGYPFIPGKPDPLYGGLTRLK